mmetsp:Transcript_14240/g.40529  ORF Transcript_14240/g.40529 Transcript_14240/m.40529 type:complete len:297 (-) Transcript_14240:74-964(-)
MPEGTGVVAQLAEDGADEGAASGGSGRAAGPRGLEDLQGLARVPERAGAVTLLAEGDRVPELEARPAHGALDPGIPAEGQATFAKLSGRIAVAQLAVEFHDLAEGACDLCATLVRDRRVAGHQHLLQGLHGDINEPGSDALHDRPVQRRMARAPLRHLQNVRLVGLDRGARVLDLRTSEDLPDGLQPLANESFVERLRLTRRQDYLEGDALGCGGDIQLIDTPGPPRVERGAPWRQEGDHVADAPHPLPEGGLKFLKGHVIATMLALLYPVLVHAHAAGPHPHRKRIEESGPAICE